jgi:TorA maturation chaperone TorD
MTGGTVAADRWELMRALGAIADSPAAARAASPSLGLTPASGAEHTSVFVLELPPYASIYLGPDGALGGEGADRVAGFWRVLGIDPPAEPDHLSALLGLYASLGEGVTSARRPATMTALSRAQGTLFWEHMQSWLPAYLDAVSDLPGRGLPAWAGLLQRVITAESARHQPCPALPLALRQAPPAAQLAAGPQEIARTLTIPVRSGMILTRHRLAAGAGQAGVGHRAGERRFTLRAMLEQDPAATLTWLAAEASRWEHRHECLGTDEAARWWAGRARLTARILQKGAVLAAGGGAAHPGADASAGTGTPE